MMKALSTRSTRRGYDRLGVESSVEGLEDLQLKRVVSVPAGVYDVGFTKIVRAPLERSLPTTKTEEKKAKKAAKVHPLLGLFDGKWGKKKMTARPEFSRYIQYLKEGGL
ncbi:hypothetical protein AKJ16_DCAP15820 [Drosera capensis]